LNPSEFRSILLRISSAFFLTGTIVSVSCAKEFILNRIKVEIIAGNR
jgi:hypothetical protein